MTKPGHVILVNGTDILARAKALFAVVRRKPLSPPNWMRPASPVPDTASELSAAAGASGVGGGDEHALYRTIRDCFDAERVHHFMWNGRNSHRSRVEASKLLVQDIALLLESGPVYVVGHSHGGNVAMYALRELQEGAAAESQALDDLQIITLSTPFLSVFREGVGAVFWGGVIPVAVASGVAIWKARTSISSLFTVPRIATVVVLAALLIWTVVIRRSRRSDNDDVGPSPKIEAAPAFLATVAIFAIGWVLTRTGWSVLPLIPRIALVVLLVWSFTSALGWLAYGFMWRSESQDLTRRVKELAMPDPAGAGSVHVVRTVADEAEGFLVVLLLSAWIGLLFTSLSRLLPIASEKAEAQRPVVDAGAGQRRTDESPWAPQKFLVYRTLVGGFVLLPVLMWSPGSVLKHWLLWLWWLPMVLSVLVLFGSVLRWLATALGLGPAHSPMIWFYGTSVEAVPPGSVPMTQVPLSGKENRNAYRLTHSSYENYDCIDAILDVIDPGKECARVARSVGGNG